MAVLQMETGERANVYVPARLAYVQNEYYAVPANSDLWFDFKLIRAAEHRSWL